MTRRAATKHNHEWLDVQTNVPRRRCGLLMIATDEEQFKTICDYETKAIKNGENVKIIGSRELKKLEPDLETPDGFIAALYSPNEYVVDPFLLGIFYRKIKSYSCATFSISFQHYQTCMLLYIMVVNLRQDVESLKPLKKEILKEKSLDYKRRFDRDNNRA